MWSDGHRSMSRSTIPPSSPKTHEAHAIGNISRRVASAACMFVVALGVAACGSVASSGPTSTVPVVRSTVYRFGVVGNKGKISQLEVDTPTGVAGISGNVTQIATSNSDGYALTSSGSVWAWGVGSYGELGGGSKPPYETTAVKVEFPVGVRISMLANPMPFDGALAIDSTGHVWGWGLNAVGDLCASGLTVLRPTQIALSDVTLATGARTHSLFYSNGRVYACGDGEAGVLGDGSDASSSKPVAVVDLPNGVPVVSLASSWEGSGALLGNGSYYDWGYNAAGQLGDGNKANSDVPVVVKLPGAVRQVSQGGSGQNNGQTVVVLSDGTVWSWGNNRHGQLGNGSRADSDVPMAVDVPSGVHFLQVNSGGYACYAIDGSGRLWAWGGNDNGQLGIGSNQAIETRPVDVGIHLEQVSSTASNVAAFG